MPKFKVGDRVRWIDRGTCLKSFGEFGTVHVVNSAIAAIGIKWDNPGHNNENLWYDTHFELVRTPQSPFEKLVFDYIDSELQP